MITAQEIIDNCEEETYAEYLTKELKAEIRTAEFLGNSKNKFQN